MLWSFFILLFSMFPQEDKYTAARERMVKDHIQSKGIHNKKVLSALRAVPRHKLVPESQRENAYLDRPLPIGAGQTISQPFIVAFMSQLIEPKKSMRVLEIGTGSGFQAAVLAEMVDQVYTIEIIHSLGEKAKADLEELGYDNIHVRIGDGYAGWPEEAPFDAIIVTAAPDRLPQPLLDQLAEGGKMVVPIGPINQIQELTLIEKKNGKIKTRNVAPVRFVPFTRDTL
ncbi:protein-L-isoaspartate(D-aspartate) O-methyltransferase [Litoribacter ruber]|uniref:Protein-L-isoaspartate O-methyltransferase n=1 Tax=Litoribacter ruber TaxID=702568 RepID=A0AAP2CGX8_9BACT|nr:MULTISPECIES: protein-L-isoaspartate(D-aspartate) O-methyltransferase [Litoribacter]MBS9524463.1 protein-L-isoaspartate(D-aspartate) O-methyltransferase [Litoribacter alkaliphilus]MBT0810367.1 protein-L-isoaspartate(D-aspartate) O-methyltransferase [Litoribacter ruber]